MKAIEGRTYAQIRAGRVQWVFQAAELPEWSEHDLEVVDVTDLDPPPQAGWFAADGQLSAEPIALADKLAAIEQQLLAAVAADIEMDGHVFQADERSRTLLASTATFVAGGGALPAGFGWRDRNNVLVPMTGAQVVALHRAIVERNYAAHLAAWQAKDALLGGV